jgi:phospholipase C
VAANNRFAAIYLDNDASIIHELRRRIQHVIYVIKENRTYDQVLGDLDRGNGDPSITEFEPRSCRASTSWPVISLTWIIFTIPGT